MKTLVLIRHAKSSWKDHKIVDIDRPLNKRGKHDAPIMADRLRKQGINPDAILSSAAKRALRTAKYFADAFTIDHNEIVVLSSLYLEGIPKILNSIHNFNNDFQTVLIFGHNPDTTGLANYLSKSHVDNIPTCGVFCMRMHVDSWAEITENSGELLFYDYPRRLAI